MTLRTLKILQAGLVAGMLDGLAAVVMFTVRGGKDPSKIFNFIASGVLGKTALTGGLPMAWLGLLFHLIIATIWAFLFFTFYNKVKLLSKNWLASGLGYGVVVWIGMNLIVVPLSRTPSLPFSLSGMLIGVFILMICVGLPISYLAHRHYNRNAVAG